MKVVRDGVVRAAGGVVTRSGAGGVEVLVVHRPHRSDWTFPKGHLRPGETDLEAAVREVAEETGLWCRAVRELGETRYEVGERPKAVRWWLMAVDADRDPGDPDGEVDEVRWSRVEDAAALLTYRGDRDLLARVGGP